jgi:hypothetical protein
VPARDWRYRDQRGGICGFRPTQLQQHENTSRALLLAGLTESAGFSLTERELRTASLEAACRG